MPSSPSESRRSFDAQRADAERPEWTETLALVHRAGEAHAEAQERARQMEAQLHELGQSASRAIERLQEEVSDLQGQLENSEARRAYAEEGLQRLCTAIREHFSGPGETSVERAETEPERLPAVAS